MSENVDGLLGVSNDSDKPLSKVAEPPRKLTLYHIKRGDAIQGPYISGQLLGMWVSGGLTADASYSTNGGVGEWKPLLDLIGELETQGNEGRQVAGSAVIASLELQQKMKSPVAAVLLGLFLPFLGGFYGSAGAAIVPLIVSVPVSFILTMLIANVRGSMSDSLAVFYLTGLAMPFAIWSLFWSLGSVKRHNAAILAQAQGKRAE